jgi:putative ABC transport system permease protein
MKPKIWRWAAREIRNQLKFSLFFILNLSIGLMGFLCLDAFKVSLTKSFQDNARANLSADLAISARRLLGDDEIENAKEVLGGKAEEGRTWEFFSMVSTGQGSRLVQIKAVDAAYPLYGDLKIETSEGIRIGRGKELNEGRVVWVYAELLAQLNAKAGDDLVIGGERFRIIGTVKEDPTQGFRMASIASKVYVGLKPVQSTALIGPGATITDTALFKLPSSMDPNSFSEEMKKKIEDPGVQIQSFQASAEDAGRTLKYLSDYLGLVSLVALFLAGLGSAYLFRSFMFSRFYQIAIFNALGLPKAEAQLIYLAQLLMLGFGASVASMLGATVMLPVLTGVLQEFTPVTFAVTLPWKTMGLALLMGVVGSLLVGWPFLKPTERLQTSQLLQEGNEVRTTVRWQDFLWFLPAIGLYWVLSIWQANSPAVGSQFVGIFLGSLAILWGAGWILLRVLAWLRPQSPWFFRQALLSLSRRKLSSLAVVVSLGLGTLLMNLLPQLKVSLKQDLVAPENMKLPSLFLFDIQDDQIGGIHSFLKSKNLELQNSSALVRARILKVNGEEYERAQTETSFQSREEESKMRFRNRGINLTYRERLTQAETLKEGRDFSGRWDEKSGHPVELSVEERFAEQMGFKLGDTLLFDIQGVEIAGQIVNLRSVKWNSFQPNFFIQMQTGVLEDAPKTFLASIAALNPEQVLNLQNEMVRLFPNVSIIDVGRLIEKLVDITNQMSWSLELMAALSLFAGFVVLFSIANYEVRRRSWDLNLLKIFGATRTSLFRYLLFEFGLLGFLSSFFGALLSLGVSFLISMVLFEGTYQFTLGWPIFSLFLVTGLSLAILWFVSRKVIEERPSELLQQK